MRILALTVTAALFGSYALAQESGVDRAYGESDDAASEAQAEEAPVPTEGTNTYDKSSYHLFNRTPKEQMRSISSDRSMKSQSPYTVDAGHVQVEVGGSYMTDESEIAGSTINLTETRLGVTNIKVGLMNDVDLQLIHLGYVSRELKIDKPTAVDSESDYGLGDMVVRLKWNIWGNDGGTFAAALMPFAIIPSSNSGFGEEEMAGGIAIPSSWKPLSWLGFNSLLELQYLWNTTSEEYYMLIASSIGATITFTDWFSIFAEFYNTQSYDENGPWTAQGNVGAYFTFWKNFQLDGGALLGITENAPDMDAYLGITVRL